MDSIATFKLLIVLSVFLNVLALGLEARGGDVFYMFKHWRLGLRAFVAMFLVVPLVATLLVISFQFRREVEIAILLLSVSPVPPLLPKKQLKSGAEGQYATGLLVGAALVSPLVALVGLHLFGLIFHTQASISFANLAMTLVITIIAPLLLGLVLQKVLGKHAQRAADVLGKVAGLMLALCALALLVMLLPVIARVIGEGTILALAIMIVAGLFAGHVLGSGTTGDRTALSLAAATRHPGVAMGIASTNFPDEKSVLVAILVYVLLAVLIAIPFMWLRRRSARPA